MTLEVALLERSRTLLDQLRIASIALVLAATACAAWFDEADAQALSRDVLARVGSADVTRQEVDHELLLANVPPDKRNNQTLKAALTELITRKYMVQQALGAKLDREPAVQLDLLRAREQVLAGAYAQYELSTRTNDIAKAEIAAYIQSNPDRFAERQLFQIEQITFAPTPDSMIAEAKNLRSLDRVETRLNELGISFKRGPGTLDGATLSPDLVKVLQARKPADIFFVHSPSNGTFFRVASVEDKPLTGEAAEKVAAQQLAGDLATKIARQTADAALANAKYVGDGARVTATTRQQGNVQAPGAADETTGTRGQPGEGRKESPKN
jgi:EpsD family peptidyl-prolyl cis-trans isomerase